MLVIFINILEKCGDGLYLGNYECDDGNKVNGDGCDENCKIEKNFICTHHSDGPDTCKSIIPATAQLMVMPGNMLKIVFSKRVKLSVSSKN